MSWFNAFEKHCGRFAIPGLIRYVVGLNALVFLLIQVNRNYAAALSLNPEAILGGQVWRLVTWIFIPTNLSPIFLLFALIILWTIGDQLEAAWGTFKLNLFYLVGMIGCTVAAFLTGGSESYNALLNLSIFFAFATVHPNFTFLLFFILPVKVKWLALLSLVLLLLQAVGGTWAFRASLLVTFSNYLLFFGPELIRKSADSRQIAARRAKFQSDQLTADTLHKCHACARTEVSHPELEFRVAADGYEYCADHLPSRSGKSNPGRNADPA